MYEKILLAVDDSKVSEKASQRALEFKQSVDAEVVAFHSMEHHMIPKELPLTVPLQNAYSFTIPQASYQEIHQAYRDKGEMILEKTKAMFEEEDLSLETRLITKQNPEDYIKEVVKEEDFDLVIMGHRGTHSKIEEILLGSVAQEVLEKAECDILVIK
jgi:nucleotide-binding universal stress UspA family protein